MYNYSFEITKDDYSQIYDLYIMARWWKESPPQHAVEYLVKNSFCFMIVKYENNIVGMGRVLSDGYSDAYLQEIFVNPDFRKQGIASNIVKHLVDFCHSKNVNWIALIAAPGSEKIYRKIGFEVMENFTPMQFQPKDKEYK